MFRHRYYRREIKTARWAAILLNLLGAMMLDGGEVGCVFLIASLAFWIGSVRPLRRAKQYPSDRQYLAYDLVMAVGLTIVITPIVWHLRGRY